jgi:hypothetical protein
VAVKTVIGTVKDLEILGSLKAVTVGAMVSEVGGSVMVTEALLLGETLPAASLAQA